MAKKEVKNSKDKTSFILGVAFVVLFSLGATLSW